MPPTQSLGERVIDGVRVPVGYEKLAVSSSVVKPLKVPAPAGGALYGATGVLITVETAAIRWRDDSNDPSSTDGNPMNPGDPPFFYPGDPTLLRFIRQSADAIVHLNYSV